jgi:anaerobic ribonucleoside-triphosphate reductase
MPGGGLSGSAAASGCATGAGSGVSCGTSTTSTGSIGVVTINLARIGFLAKDKEDYKERLVHLMDLSKESLEIKSCLKNDRTETDM